MEMRRRIPYGVINWGRLVRECLFVDNTAYIRRLEEVDTPVFLRPKRFGKSVVCSMLAHYYDVNLRDSFDEYDNFTNELVVSGRDAEYNAVCGYDSQGDATRESSPT